MEVPAVCVNQEFRCTKLSPDGLWRCNLMVLKGKSLCEEHSGGNKSGIMRNRCDEEKYVVFDGYRSGVPVVHGGVKHREMPKGSKNVEEKSVLEENVGGIKNDKAIGRQRCSKIKEKINFYDGSASGARLVLGAVDKRARREGSRNMYKDFVIKENDGGVKSGKMIQTQNMEKGKYLERDTIVGRVIIGERGVNIPRKNGGGVGGVDKRVREKDLKNEKKKVFEKNGGGDESDERGMRRSKVNDEIEMLLGGEVGQEAVPKKQYVDIAREWFLAMRKKEEHGSGMGLVLGVGKKRGWPRGSKNVKKKLVLEENSSRVGRGKQIGRQDGLRNEHVYNVSDEDTCADDTAQEVGPNTPARPSRLKSAPAWAKDFIN